MLLSLLILFAQIAKAEEWGINTELFERARNEIVSRLSVDKQSTAMLDLDVLEIEVKDGARKLADYRANPNIETRVKLRDQLYYLARDREDVKNVLKSQNGNIHFYVGELWAALGYKLVPGKTPIPLRPDITPAIFRVKDRRIVRPAKMERYLDRIKNAPASTWTPGVPASPGNGPTATPSRFDHES